MPRKSRQEEIIKAIREYLIDAVRSMDPITDDRLMRASKCGRATFYKYVTKGSAIESEIEVARTKQKKYAAMAKQGALPELEPALRRRCGEAEEGARELLAFIARVTANLINYGVPAKLIQRAQHEAMPHPNRSFSHSGRGRNRN